MFCLLIIIFISAITAQPAFNTNQLPGRSVIVHLFEWKFSDIALECERWLGPKGYGAVQLSPVNEHLIFTGRPWWERYQPLSYKINTRSGDKNDFLNMTKRCNANGVRIYVDVVLNHMAGENPPPVIGTANSYAYPDKYEYPGVPYKKQHFNKPCDIKDWNDRNEMRNCEVQGLRDLNLTQEYVRGKMVGFLNDLIKLGTAGFRIDSAKHIWPEDLEVIYSRLNNLNTDFGFAAMSRPFIYHEVVDYGSQSSDLGRWNYIDLGMVTDFMIAGELGRAFRGYYELKYLQNWGPQWNFLPSKYAIVFVDEHEFQRGYGYGGSDALTYRDPKWYKMSNAFLLAHPHGTPRVLSSYYFQTAEQGPPHDIFDNILSQVFETNGLCSDTNWICEHRWKAIANMIGFRNVVYGMAVRNWWDNENKQISFSRGEFGFIAWNNESNDLDELIQTCMPPGLYCDVISGELSNGHCTGKMIEVDVNGMARINILGKSDDGVLAIHSESALNGYCPIRNYLKFIRMFWETKCFQPVKILL